MPATKLRYKILLILFGFFLAAALLEAGLRLGGFIFLRIEESKNSASIARQGETRILCLGESTTALGGDWAYPRQLEQILNGQGKGGFTVINKGIPSITTSHIVTHLKKYLDDYRPRIVTVMMGINDGAVSKSSYENNLCFCDSLAEHSRVFKFIRLLKTHIFHLRTEIQIRNLQRRVDKLKREVEANPSSANYTKLAALYRVLLQWDDEEKVLKKAIELDGRNFEALGYMGINLRRKGDYAGSIRYFREAVDASPDTGDYKLVAYTFLAEAHSLLGQLKEAEAVHREALAKIPNYLNGHYFIGELHLQQDQYGQAIESFRQQLEVNPGSVLTYGKLAFCLRKLGYADTARHILDQGLKLNPKSVVLHAELASHLIEQKDFTRAEEILKTALTLKEDLYERIDINFLDYLLASYEGQNKDKEAREIKKIIKARRENYNPDVYTNYHLVQKILAERNIMLIAVQYPMRPIDNLKKILNASPNVIYVDNEESFKEGVREKGYDHFFTDRFAGDFGHCTPEGNRLVAQNIARAVFAHFE